MKVKFKGHIENCKALCANYEKEYKAYWLEFALRALMVLCSLLALIIALSNFYYNSRTLTTICLSLVAITLISFPFQMYFLKKSKLIRQQGKDIMRFMERLRGYATLLSCIEANEIKGITFNEMTVEGDSIKMDITYYTNESSAGISVLGVPFKLSESCTDSIIINYDIIGGKISYPADIKISMEKRFEVG